MKKTHRELEEENEELRKTIRHLRRQLKDSKEKNGGSALLVLVEPFLLGFVLNLERFYNYGGLEGAKFEFQFVEML